MTINPLLTSRSSISIGSFGSVVLYQFSLGMIIKLKRGYEGLHAPRAVWVDHAMAIVDIRLLEMTL